MLKSNKAGFWLPFLWKKVYICIYIYIHIYTVWWSRLSDALLSFCYHTCPSLPLFFILWGLFCCCLSCQSSFEWLDITHITLTPMHTLFLLLLLHIYCCTSIATSTPLSTGRHTQRCPPDKTEWNISMCCVLLNVFHDRQVLLPLHNKQSSQISL